VRPFNVRAPAHQPREFLAAPDLVDFRLPAHSFRTGGRQSCRRAGFRPACFRFIRSQPDILTRRDMDWLPHIGNVYCSGWELELFCGKASNVARRVLRFIRDHQRREP
jgi:hypothetical protein